MVYSPLKRLVVHYLFNLLIVYTSIMDSLGKNDLCVGRLLDGWHAGEDIFPDLKRGNGLSFKDHLVIKARGECEDHFRVEDLKSEVEESLRAQASETRRSVPRKTPFPSKPLLGRDEVKTQLLRLRNTVGRRSTPPSGKDYLSIGARGECEDHMKAQLQRLRSTVGRRLTPSDVMNHSSTEARGEGKDHFRAGGLTSEARLRIAMKRRLTPSKKMRIFRRRWEVAMRVLFQAYGFKVEERRRYRYGGTWFTVSLGSMEFRLAHSGDHTTKAGCFKIDGVRQDTDSLFALLNAGWKRGLNLWLSRAQKGDDRCLARRGDDRGLKSFIVDILDVVQGWLQVRMTECEVKMKQRNP